MLQQRHISSRGSAETVSPQLLTETVLGSEDNGLLSVTASEFTVWERLSHFSRPLIRNKNRPGLALDLSSGWESGRPQWVSSTELFALGDVSRKICFFKILSGCLYLKKQHRAGNIIRKSISFLIRLQTLNWMFSLRFVLGKCTLHIWQVVQTWRLGFNPCSPRTQCVKSLHPPVSRVLYKMCAAAVPPPFYCTLLYHSA